MEKEKQSYLELENEYSKLCETQDLLWQVLTFRQEIPGIYGNLLKKEAKIWASKQKHPNIVLNEEITRTLSNLKIDSSRIDMFQEIDTKVNLIAEKSGQNKKMLEEVERKTEDINTIKDVINKNIHIIKNNLI
ncbi:uncharacterized protein LOC129610349 [Condylostylus longicornis]|uniref:uncharacterized protein LOC129610349 n=1 Tax=Condylostylus longicornis TaxID=2530218 RepID=UPI00244DEECA|nr:uncharacterized protein LOC129610349 [Condylostylus longicornis]